jgi:hypothetical protein
MRPKTRYHWGRIHAWDIRVFNFDPRMAGLGACLLVCCLVIWWSKQGSKLHTVAEGTFRPYSVLSLPWPSMTRTQKPTAPALHQQNLPADAGDTGALAA